MIQFCVDAASLLFQQGFGDGQAESGRFFLSGQICGIEPFKKRIQVGGSDAKSCIGKCNDR